MTDPVLVIHGVSNRDRDAFERQVKDLNRRVGGSWMFLPVFWGDLGGQTLGLEDAIPSSRLVRGGDLQASPELIAGLLATEEKGLASLTRSGENWIVVANAAVSAAPETDSAVRVRGEETAEAIREAIREAWPETQTLQHIENQALLEEIGRAVAEAVEEPSAEQSVVVRGGFDEIRGFVRGVLRGIDRAAGAIVGTVAGSLNTYLRTQFGPGIGRFLGDIFVYQRKCKEIQGRLWEKLDREAPGWGSREKPISVIAHSLGGVICFDAALGTGERQLWIRRFITFGSQSAFFHILDPRGGGLASYSPGVPVALPESIGGWTNLWESLDPLAFLAGKIFLLHPASAKKAPVDIEVPHLASAGLWTHSVYWTGDALVEAIREAFR